ncbi:hypothetical protein EVAR_45069_1 [Eumeta japonica]|uniref:Uncharacterized protein n=1 Tax=Eumeta variegata TaxID=151549 RepID=A0A4C1XYF1_EUMVA|nr:hypothetical protein EVAR_45069_1 [Eumeta japonica]
MLTSEAVIINGPRKAGATDARSGEGHGRARLRYHSAAAHHTDVRRSAPAIGAPALPTNAHNGNYIYAYTEGLEGRLAAFVAAVTELQAFILNFLQPAPVVH